LCYNYTAMNELIYLIQTPPFWLKTPPLSLFYLKAYLQKKGIKTKIIDLNMGIFKMLGAPLGKWLTLNADLENNLFTFIETEYPLFLENVYKNIKSAPFIGFSLTKRNTPFTFKLAEKIKNRFPAKKIIFGGPNTLFLENVKKLDPQDCWVIGEGEIPLYEIIKNDKIRIARFQEIEDLDTLPLYDFSPLDIHHYSNTLPLFSSRGCPFSCRFCTERKLTSTYRQHSPEYMVEQIRYLQKKYRVNSFVFCDSLINYRKNWLEDFCRLLINNDLKINWEAQARITKNFSLTTAKLLKKSGCYNLFIGLESGSDIILKAMNKGFTTAIAQDFFRILSKSGIHFEISLILGYPGENEKEFLQTVNFILKNKKNIPKIAQVNPFIDYSNLDLNENYASATINNKVEKILNIFKRENIKYTKSFINNLMYSN